MGDWWKIGEKLVEHREKNGGIMIEYKKSIKGVSREDCGNIKSYLFKISV